MQAAGGKGSETSTLSGASPEPAIAESREQEPGHDIDNPKKPSSSIKDRLRLSGEHTTHLGAHQKAKRLEPRVVHWVQGALQCAMVGLAPYAGDRMLGGPSLVDR